MNSQGHLKFVQPLSRQNLVQQQLRDEKRREEEAKAEQKMRRQERFINRRASPDKAAAGNVQTGGKKPLAKKGGANLAPQAISGEEQAEVVEDVAT